MCIDTFEIQTLYVYNILLKIDLADSIQFSVNMYIRW